MNHLDIIGRAARMVRHSRALWILGILYALTGGGGGGNGFEYSLGSGDFDPDINPLGALGPAEIALLCGAALAVFLVLSIAHYVIRAGLLRVLDHQIVDGVEPTVRRGVSEGWDSRTWRLLGVDIVSALPIVALLIAFLVAAVAVAVAGGSLEDPGPGAVLGFIGLGLMAIAVLIVLAIVLGILRELWWRLAVVEDLSLADTLSVGWDLFRAHTRDLVVMQLWLVLVALAALVGMGMALAALLAVAAVVVGIPAYALYLATDSEALGLLLAVPGAVVIVGIPLLVLIGGYSSMLVAVWSLVFRQIRPIAPTTIAYDDGPYEPGIEERPTLANL